MTKETREYWHSLDTFCLYLPSEVLSYHLYLLEQAQKKKKTKEEKAEKAIVAFYKKKLEKDLEEDICLKM